MPIIRYFIIVGGLLLALLFAADRYLPAPVEAAALVDPDRTIIRIKSARRLPEKIVFDTQSTAEVPIVTHAAPIEINPITKEPERQVSEASTTKPAPPSVEVRKDASTSAARPRAKRSAKLQKRLPDRRLAFERSNPFAGGWW